MVLSSDVQLDGDRGHRVHVASEVLHERGDGQVHASHVLDRASHHHQQIVELVLLYMGGRAGRGTQIWRGLLK